jgi:hypothetical protein
MIRERWAALMRRSLVGASAVSAVFVVSWGVNTVRDVLQTEGGSPFDLPDIPPAISAAGVLRVPQSMTGKSGALRYQTLTPGEAVAVPGFVSLLGEQAIRTPAVHYLAHPLGDSVPSGFALIVTRPFGEKKGEYLGRYRLGRWPAERWIISRAYANPSGFIEVTEKNVQLSLSPHFTLGDFLTHDQPNVWPKYVIVEPKLIDKLELVVQELERRGIPARTVRVLSGFRAPYYNERGVGEGMARTSRHMFGDAADIIIDDDGDGRMDDLNRDRRPTVDDTRPLVNAIAAVEAAHPELTGGLGTYAATGPSGPFAHIDVRGTSARWESGWWKK